MNKKIRMVLAEDEPAILRGLSANIRQFSGDYEITSTAYNGKDALEKIKRYKPDIVITDIKIPLMDGLDLIEAGRRESPDTVFVILTGYAQFEYAKRAMKLQVVDYLLKPVDQDALEKLLEKQKDRIFLKREEEMRDYLSSRLYRDTLEHKGENPFSGTMLYLLFAFYGSLTAGMYNELTTGSLIAQGSDYSFLNQVASMEDIYVFPMRGNYRNETVFAIVADTLSPGVKEAIKAASRAIHKKILCNDIFVNAILSGPIADGMDIPGQIRSCYLYAVSHIVFGQSRLMVYEGMSGQTEKIAVDPWFRKIVKGLKLIMDEEETRSLAESIISYWSEQKAAQIQIQTDLHFLLNGAVQKVGSAYELVTPPSELLASSASYEELKANLGLEFHKLWTGKSLCGAKMPHTQAVAERIRNYIDRNYTQTITYKNFTEEFGYHEKYIGSIFKEIYGISPSKYILELRLEAAKSLMRQYPEMRLKDIAQAVGYDDALYFSRVFKNSQGISPKAYQKERSL